MQNIVVFVFWDNIFEFKQRVFPVGYFVPEPDNLWNSLPLLNAPTWFDFYALADHI